MFFTVIKVTFRSIELLILLTLGIVAIALASVLLYTSLHYDSGGISWTFCIYSGIMIILIGTVLRYMIVEYIDDIKSYCY